MLKKYPFHSRLLLFLIPILCVLLAEGVAAWMKILKANGVWVGIILCGLLLFAPMRATFYYFWHSRCHDFGRLVMQYLGKNYQPGALIYVSGDSAFAFAYYASQTKFNEALPVSFLINWDNQNLRAVKWGRFTDLVRDGRPKPHLQFYYEYYCFNELALFQMILTNDFIRRRYELFHDTRDDFIDHRDSWVYLSHIKPEAKKIILDYFDARAKRVKQFEIEDTGLYLFSFNK